MLLLFESHDIGFGVISHVKIVFILLQKIWVAPMTNGVKFCLRSKFDQCEVEVAIVISVIELFNKIPAVVHSK